MVLVVGQSRRGMTHLIGYRRDASFPFRLRRRYRLLPDFFLPSRTEFHHSFVTLYRVFEV